MRRRAGVMLRVMRGLVLALVLGVSSVAPTVCEVVCDWSSGAHQHHHDESDDAAVSSVLKVVSGGEEHDCEHPEVAPATVEQSRGRSDRLAAVDLPLPAAEGLRAVASLLAPAPVPWSSPHSPPPIVPLRI